MLAISHLNPTWEHTLTDLLNHDPKTQMEIIMRAWVKDNDMTDFTAMLTYTPDKFTPTGSLCYYKEKVDAEIPKVMPTKLLQKLYNLRKYITHVMNESDYDPDDTDFDHALSEHNWLSQTRGKFMNYAIYMLSDGIESRPISNKNQKWSVSRKVSKGKKLPILHSKMKGILMASAEVCTSLLSHMNVNKCEIQITHLVMLKRTYLKQNRFSCFLCLIVRKYVHTTDAQSVWKDFQDHMKSS